jgi:hypothetical protein
MKLSVQVHPLPVAGAFAPGLPSAPALRLKWGALGADGIAGLPSGEEPSVGDKELFKALLSDDRTDESPADREGQDTGRHIERPANRPERHADIARVASRHDGAECKGDNARDTAVIGALDVVAISAVVTKVYLENQQERERAVHVALDDDLLPATRLAISEREGRLAVDFVSMHPGPRGRLRRGAPVLADRVAGELARDVSVRVAAHDGDRLALEVCADAMSSARGPRRP